MTVGLSGVRVVDFGHYIAGPMAALLLADAGADVVHIDRPSIDRPNIDRPNIDLPSEVSTADIAGAFLHRGKRRVTLDLKQPDDLAAARSLVQHADVVIENFRPGVMERLGLGPTAMLADNSQLIYCSLPGFAADDERAQVRAWEGIVQAATAGYRPLNEHWDPTGRRRALVDDRSAPLFTPIPTASNFGAMLGATMIVAALIARERTGLGQRIELPLAEAMVEAYSTMMGHRVYDDAGTPDNIMLSDMSYQCADGGMIDLSPHPKFVIRLLVEAGVAPEWEQRGLIDVAANTFNAAERGQLQEAFVELIRSRPAREWDDIGMKLKTPLSMVRTPAQWLASEHAMESGSVVQLDDPVFGPVVMPGAAFDTVGFPDQFTAARTTDEGRHGILDWWRGADGVERSRADGAVFAPGERPLDGLRAVDITQAVAGPTAARLLADLGVEVIKVGSPTPAVTDGIVGHLHRGKRTILLDTRPPEGREILGRLIREADVLVTNFMSAAALKYGLDYESLSAIKPDLVYCAISAYGSTGPWATRRAYENQCNAATGMSWSYGSPFGWTLYQPTPINDAATGILGALATVVALFDRSRGGRGHKVGTSLAQASTWHQATNLVRSANTANDPDEVRNAYGPTALHRLYRASDRSFFLAAFADDQSLLKVVGADADDEIFETWRDAGGPLASTLATHFAAQPAQHWVSALNAAGVDAQNVQTLDEAIAYLADRGLVYFEPGVEGDFVARPGIGSWLTATPPRVGANPGPVGTQALEILREMGITDDEITALSEAGIVRLPHQLPKVTMWT